MPRHLPVNADSGKNGNFRRVDAGTSRRSRIDAERPATDNSNSSRILYTADPAFPSLWTWIAVTKVLSVLP
jgi:hypothetical protein